MKALGIAAAAAMAFAPFSVVATTPGVAQAAPCVGVGANPTFCQECLLSAFSGISAHFRPRRHLLNATGWRSEMADRFAVWHVVTELDNAA
ncbi:MAG TPA: hypothetical protein VEF72_19015 [Mycobacterium sp.]|nr:hypothetical protein [Mycobacterium sp.]